ncbi:Aste57867_9845 [Aphanomyces stellatus]|uniref:Aste57867_9845 protein n=1 Tax=Aphanomyces stellatus TaxID=120398 RepID=A0A485KNV9_9STRA|nr:hypothetical protein As57867_009806 [Aphanomyces stellatus]VFT86724.1 Aste57867_9845 [Aphanomyces stellatus]
MVADPLGDGADVFHFADAEAMGVLRARALGVVEAGGVVTRRGRRERMVLHGEGRPVRGRVGRGGAFGRAVDGTLDGHEWCWAVGGWWSCQKRRMAIFGVDGYTSQRRAVDRIILSRRMRERERGLTGWVCHLCSKINPADRTEGCMCCGRPRAYAPKSVANTSHTKAVILHADLSTITRPEQVADMVRGGMQPNDTTMDGLAALHCAALHGQAAVVRALLNEGAAVELPAPDGRRALHFAAASMNVHTVQELLSWRADPNATSSGDAWTPLHVAASKGFHAAIDALMRSGANALLATSHMRQTALHVAADAGHLRCVEVLLQHTNMELLKCADRSGATALQLAHFAQQTLVYELLYLHMSDSVLHDRTLDRLLASTACQPHTL